MQAARVTTLSEYVHRHVGQTGTIVGKGQTRYDYNQLTDEPGPVFFINDAVQLERHLRPDQPSYLFFLDSNQAYWLRQRLRSTIVVPERFVQFPGRHLQNNLCQYSRRFGHTSKDRNTIAKQGSLYLAKGTICPTIDFAWVTGIAKLRMIGCDGINDRYKLGGSAYDARLDNPSNGRPRWLYQGIRECQENILRHHGIEAEYIGNPLDGVQSDPIYVSFGTPRYGPMLDRLEASAKSFGLPLDITRLTHEFRSWVEACAYKPQFLLEMTVRHCSRPIVWVDADAEFRAQPELFKSIPGHYDIAHGVRRDHEVLSGTIWIAPTDKARRIVRTWAQFQQRATRQWDQRVLADVLRTLRVQAFRLPPSYVYIDTIFATEHPDVTPVIYHHQASRQFR